MDEDESNNKQDRQASRRRASAARLGAFRGADNEGSNNMDARPEEAPSSMGNAHRNRAEPAAAAAAAAADGAPTNVAVAARNRAAEDADGTGNNPRLNEFLRHLREFCRDGDSNKSPNASAINIEKARNVLEACAGNVPLAGQLYWDDYFATQQHQQQQQRPDNPPPPPLEAPSAPVDPPGDDGEEERRVRRRLESDFERLLPAPPPEQAPLEPLRVTRKRRRRRRAPEAEAEIGVLAAADIGPLPAAARNNNRHNVDEDAEPARPPARPRQALRQQDNEALFVAARAVLGAGEDATEASVSVSDDEAGVADVLRMVRESRRAGRRRRRSSFDNHIEYIRARNILPEEKESKDSGQKQRNAAGAGGDGGNGSSDDESAANSDDEDAYLSDNDWLFTAASRESSSSSAAAALSTSQPTENLRAPLRVLWSASNSSLEETKKPKDVKEDADDSSPPQKKIKKEPKDDDGEMENENGEDTNDTPPSPTEAKLPEIPSTWLHASFSPHASAMGLAVKDPKPEDVAEHSLRVHQINNDSQASNARRNNTVPLPYHCRGITAILSIVSAMIFSGASVQSQQVTCSSSRVPFLELTEEQRKREFESRLIDALASLIFIAARASMDRKKKALAKRIARKNRKRKRQMITKEGGSSIDDEDTEAADVLQKGLERKLKLCPVAWWKENGQGAPILPEEQWENALVADSTQGPKIQLNVTFGTNLEDIRAYVKSSMPSFTAPGGLALLLETIIGIHGEGSVNRMLRKSRQAAGKSGQKKDESKASCLIHCTCQERQKKALQDPSLSATDRRKMTNSLDTTPPGHECVSIELISLILTGKVHSSLKGWSTGSLGFGILSNKAGEVARALSRPELPVWCLRGETCYSVAFLDYTVHGDNLNQRFATSSETSQDEKSRKGPAKEKSRPAVPCMKVAACSSTSRSRDLAEARAFARSDQPGCTANLVHWNPWYGLRNLSGLRLITARSEWNPPAPSWVVAQYKAAPKAKPSSSLTCERKSVVQQLRERRSSQTRVVSSEDEQDVLETILDEAALDRVRLHPDDAKFYPKQHRLWRFDMGETGSNADPNSKPRGDHWVPYHSLSRQEQMIVETKFGPQINRILWTRWPGATIDKFIPEGKKEPLPIV